MKRIFGWIINTFSYIQIYFFIGLFLLFSLFPIIYFWVQTNVERIGLIDDQISEIEEMTEFKRLYDSIQKHRLLALRYSFNKDEEIRKKMDAIEESVKHDIFGSGGLLDPTKRAEKLTNGASPWEKVHLFNHTKRWNDILHQSSHLPFEVIEFMYTTFLDDIRMEFAYLAERSGISYFLQLDRYIFLQSVLLIIASMEESLTELAILSEKLINNPNNEVIRGQIFPLIEIIETNLELLNHGKDLYTYNYVQNPEDKHILNELNKYNSLIEQLTDLIKKRVLHQPEPDITFAEFREASQIPFELGNQLWVELLKMQKNLFINERTALLYKFWLILSISLLLITLAFFLQFILTYGGIKRLSQLTQATDSFTNGDLVVRVPEEYHDEIGRQAQAFNRMAQRLEELIKHLYELIDATSELANGHLTARIPSFDPNHEFGQVALSFNKMAETFETIIGRLQRIGLTLTTSATEIASASKEQETIVVEQEATTREIAIAANEISSTAKEFAITMNQVSLAADQTSDLALKGKGSLNNMELIMHNMVEASSKIASKLAVLNEKASNITSVITTITKVADQTNLLSLNASIEAEKAGDYGRSFAVIAREIRRLADQTAIATLDIKKMVNEIMAAVSSSVIGVDDFNQAIRNGAEQVRSVGEQLATIIEQVQSFTGRFEVVNQGMQAQSKGAEQINEAIAQLSQTARQTTEAIYQFHKTVQGLNQASNELSILNPFSSLKNDDSTKE